MAAKQRVKKKRTPPRKRTTKARRNAPNFRRWAIARARLSEFEAHLFHPRSFARAHLTSGPQALAVSSAEADRGEPPFTNAIHATGVGLSSTDPERIVYKIFVYPESKNVAAQLTWKRSDVEIEPLPVFTALHAATPLTAPVERPFFGGLSIGPLGTNSAGTLGCLLHRTATGEILLLSNNHVLTDSTRLTQASICQPAPFDGGTSQDVVADLADVIPLNLNSPLMTDFDAATALIQDPGSVELGRIHAIDYQPARLKAAVPGMRVTLSGRSSTSSQGIVKSLVRGARVSYSNVPVRVATIRECWNIEGVAGRAFAAPGDSGALVIERDTGAPVGMVFSASGTRALASELTALCRRLQAFPI